MPVTEQGDQEKSGVVGGIVAEHVDRNDARPALHDLEGRGFAVIPVSGDILAAASRAAAELSAMDRSQRVASGMTALSALRTADLADVMVAAIAAVSAIAEGVPVLDLQLGGAVKRLQPAFDAVVDAVTRPTVPAPAWFSQARRNAAARQEFLDEFGAFTSEDIASLAGSQAANRRATAHRWQAERKVFAVDHHGHVLYPGFQFDADTGRPKPAVADTLAALPEAMTGWALALWWTTPVDLLDWARPVDLVDTAADELARAARAEAADWAQATPA